MADTLDDTSSLRPGVMRHADNQDDRDGGVRHEGRAFGRIPSPRLLLLRIVAIFCLGEGAVMVLLPALPGGADRVTAPLLDVLMLTFVTAPFLWWLVVRPLRRAALDEHARAAIVVANARDAIVTTDAHGVIVSFNAAAEVMFGYTADEVVGRPAAMLAPARYRTVDQRGHERIGDQSGARDGHGRFVAEGLRKDGNEFPVEMSLTTWAVGERTFRTAIVRDVTERKQADEAIRTRTAQLEAVRAVAAEITRELDLAVLLELITRRAAELLRAARCSVLLWNESKQRLCSRTHYGVDGSFNAVEVALGEGFTGTVAQQRRGAILRSSSSSASAFPEIADGQEMSLVAQPLVYRDRVLGVIVVGERASSRQFHEPDLDMLGLLADQAATAIENARLYEEVQSLAVTQERQRIAREMHDGLAQTLGLLHLQIGRLREERADGTSGLDAALRDMSAVAEQGYDELRQSLFGLRTTVSRGLGWIPTLRAYLQEFSALTGIPIDLVVEDEVPGALSPATEVQLVRIIQEALSNVSKHASAGKASVRLDGQDGRLHVTVEDDGRGFQPAVVAATKPHHFGIATMRERAESLGGTLDVESAPGHGTRVRATLPART